VPFATYARCRGARNFIAARVLLGEGACLGQTGEKFFRGGLLTLHLAVEGKKSSQKSSFEEKKAMERNSRLAVEKKRHFNSPYLRKEG